MDQFCTMLQQNDADYTRIRNDFLLGSQDFNPQVIAIYKVNYNKEPAIPVLKARLRSFEFYETAIKVLRGSSNTQRAWYRGTYSEIQRFICYGFHNHQGMCGTGMYGCGISLLPYSTPLYTSALECMNDPVPNESGLLCNVLCRAILGNQEVVTPGKEQCSPSTAEFDSGVDDILSPTKYVVWSVHSNRILPEFVVTFRVPFDIQDLVDKLKLPQRSRSQVILFLNGVGDALGKKWIFKLYGLYRAGRLTETDLVQQIVARTGYSYLRMVIKKLDAKNLALPSFKGVKRA